MTLTEKIKKYELTEKDWFKHKHYTIITRMGIDKIQAYEKIDITFDAVKVEPKFCVVKATGKKDTLKVQTFGSAKYGGKEWIEKTTSKKGYWLEHGNTSTWYVMEMAEKRAMSRVVLKITGFYELGVFGEDESEDFKEKNKEPKEKIKQKVERKEALTAEQFLKAKNATKDQIINVLGKFRMTPEQRNILTRISQVQKAVEV